MAYLVELATEPMLHATEQGLEVDTFVIYTDNETWAGDVHPHQALAEYRRRRALPDHRVRTGTLTSHRGARPSPALGGMLMRPRAALTAADLSLLDGWVRSLNLPVKGTLAAPTA